VQVHVRRWGGVAFLVSLCLFFISVATGAAWLHWVAYAIIVIGGVYAGVVRFGHREVDEDTVRRERFLDALATIPSDTALEEQVDRLLSEPGSPYYSRWRVISVKRVVKYVTARLGSEAGVENAVDRVIARRGGWRDPPEPSRRREWSAYYVLRPRRRVHGSRRPVRDGDEEV
jgi:hypothetical protein